MKHNKKRNTAFLYECLIRELTRAIIKENKEKQETIQTILKEFFMKGKPLKNELNLYNSLIESKELSADFSRRLLVETKKAVSYTHLLAHETNSNLVWRVVL